jgi:hypothetical protein
MQVSLDSVQITVRHYSVQYRLTDHVTLNFNNNIFTAAVFLNIEKAFDTLWHPGLLYKLSTMEFSTKSN